MNQLQCMDLLCILFQRVKSNYKNVRDNWKNLNTDLTYLIIIRKY